VRWRRQENGWNAPAIPPDGKDAIMKRRGLVVIHGLVLGVVVVTPALGQQSNNQRKTLGQRMAELRRGWTHGDETIPAEQFPNPQEDGNSVVPNWLSGGKPKKQSQGHSHERGQNSTRRNGAQQQQPGRNAQSQANRSTPQQRTAQQGMAAEQKGAQRSEGGNRFTLPGLGGSPLPSAERTTQQNRSGSNASNRYATSPQHDPDYPVIRDTASQSKSPATASNGRSRSSTAAQSAARKSPKNFSRELSGSFSPGAGGPSARMAQADNGPATSGELAIDATENTPQESQETTPLEPSLTAPSAESMPETSDSTPRFEPTGEDEPRSAAEAFSAPARSRSGFGASEFIRSPRTNAMPEIPSAARSREAFGEALQVAGGGDPTVLVSNHTPIISTDIRGPKQILVGRESIYRVRLQNQGATSAEGIVAAIRIPSSAEIVGTTATQGTVKPSQSEGSRIVIDWELSKLDARGSEVLDIRLIPRESRPLELGVSWTVAPVGSRAIVEVQEPKLNIEIGGPTEVLFDKPQVYRLTLSNPGTGAAENVRIDLVPPGGTQESATSHAFGNLAPGENKSIEIELTAREAGKLMMKAVATAEGGLTSDASKEIFCRKPELEVDWRGPATKYAGTPATYFFRVRNPGTAPAEDVTVEVALPEGAEFASASEGQEFSNELRTVKWQVGTLDPGDDNYMELKCVVNAAGANQFKITASNAAGNLSDSEVAETNVEAIADLKLSVSDPSGPVAVGTPAVYEITVKNRGANTARNVNVVALFSEGIEPEQAEGGTYSVADGRVSFRTIDELAAGGEVKLRISARALRPGTHVFRAEVLCSDLEIKLAAEETTRFYTDEVMPEAAESSEPTTSRQGFEAAVR
jgi:uncharacterized repeat protein (TIGR01451 family)